MATRTALSHAGEHAQQKRNLVQQACSVCDGQAWDNPVLHSPCGVLDGPLCESCETAHICGCCWCLPLLIADVDL